MAKKKKKVAKKYAGSGASKAKKKAAKKKAAKKKTSEPGFARSPSSNLFVPEAIAAAQKPVSVSALERGIAEAKGRLRDLIEEIADSAGDGFEVSGVTFEASFSADGKFLGIGVGGATAIKITVRPTAE